MGKRLLCLLVVGLAVIPGLLRAQGSAFTYQGRLLDAGEPANGNYDLQFSLTSTADQEGYVGPTLTLAPVLAVNGAFTAQLDFGSGVFDGSPRWIEIGVRAYGSESPYTVLSPRQPITPAPYALFAANAAGGGRGASTNPVVYGALSFAGTTESRTTMPRTIMWSRAWPILMRS